MKLSRRTVLRGVGVTMALPWLESLNAIASTPAPFPKRFAVLFMGNGINGNHWWAKGSGAEMKLSRSLAPLEPLKKKINVINGLFNKPAVGMAFTPDRPATCYRACRFRRVPSSGRGSRWTRSSRTVWAGRRRSAASCSRASSR